MARRGYAKFKNDFYLNGKARELRSICPSALGAFVFAVTYCSDNLTDGRISDRDLHYVLGIGDEEIDALCAVDMLEPDGNGGYVIHDYTEHNSRRAQVEKKREQSSKNYRKRRFSSLSSDIHPDESELNRTKHKNTRTQEDSSKDESPYSPPGGGEFDEYTQEFEQCWTAYPKKTDKREAFKAFKAAKRRTSFAVIYAGVQKYATDPNLPSDLTYVKSMANWLRGDCWSNPPLPERRAGGGGGPGPSRSQQNLDHNRKVVERALALERAEEQAARKEIGS
ncbi:hypothetical protein [Bifidobacterium aemilianum]|nr:hypothetical protein [Bifidobacterium aemilianum]